MVETYLDRLPPELLFEILSYLSCNHIIRAFHSVNDYLSDVLLTYDNYQLDLSSSTMEKSEFDLICSFLRLEQIVGLKLSKNRFDIINRFLLKKRREQALTRLRSLWIDETILYDRSFAEQIQVIIDFNKLISLRLDRIHFRPSNELPTCLFESLTHLVVCSSHQFRQLLVQTPTHLTFLHMFFDSVDDLNYCLLPNAHQLKSLGVGIRCDLNNIHQFTSLFKNYQWTQLIQFNLNLTAADDIQFETLERILSPMIGLKYLTLILSKQSTMNNKLFNGNKWKLFLSTFFKHLKTFNFNFPVDEPTYEHYTYSCLKTFQSTWWLNKKQWFVEYVHQLGAFVTIPYFAPKIFDNLSLSSFDAMVNAELFYSNIKELRLNSVEEHQLDEVLLWQHRDRPRFYHVKRLSLNGHLTMDILDKIRYNVDTKIIEHFQLSSTVDDSHLFVELLTDMMSLSSLDVQFTHSLDLLHLRTSPLLSVRRLVLLGYETRKRKVLFSHLCRVFPRVTHLKTQYHSRRTLCFLLNNLVHLEQLNLHLSQGQHAPNHAWIERHSRLSADSFESEVFNIEYTERIFVLWINADKNIEHGRPRKFQKCPIQ